MLKFVLSENTYPPKDVCPIPDPFVTTLTDVLVEPSLFNFSARVVVALPERSTSSPVQGSSKVT
jgi:hypothetical protein